MEFAENALRTGQEEEDEQVSGVERARGSRAELVN